MGVCLERNFWMDLVLIAMLMKDLRRDVWILQRWTAGLLSVHLIKYWLNGFVNLGLDDVLFVCEQ
jgi:hypothetical protein